MDSKVIINAEIEGSSEIILSLLDYLAIDFSEFNPESSFTIVEVEKNYIKKYHFDELNICSGTLSESMSIEGQWKFTFVGSAEYSILKELMEIIKPYVIGNDTWGLIFKDDFPIIYNGGLEYYPKVENEIKVIYEF